MALEAASPLRLYVTTQQRARGSLPLATSRREYSRRRFVCCANPHHQQQQQSNEEAQLRAEISPSVLRALQPQDPSSSPKIPGESLIERNLRKRAAANQASSAEQSSSASAADEGLSSAPKEQGLPASFTSQHHAPTFLSAESGFLSGYGERSKDSLKDALSNPCPISTVFWQEKPLGFSMENFHDLDFFASHFRLSLCLHITFAEDLEYMQSLSVSSLLWLLLPSDGFTNSFFPGDGENLRLEWRKDVAENLGKITENEKILSGATEVFSTFWSPKSWKSRVNSGKAMELVLVLAYSAYVYILSGAADNTPNLKKKLEDCSGLLNRAVTQLHGSVLDPVGVWEKALKGTSFALDGSAYVYDHALIFPCKFWGGAAEFGSMLDEVQECLDKEYKDLDLVALLQRSSDNPEKFFILIAPWYWVLTLEPQRFTPVPGILAMSSCLATSTFASAGLGFGFAWEQYGVPLGWAGIVASMFFINNRQFPLLCPFPSLGAIGKFSSNLGNLPSRKSFVRAILKTSCAPLAASLLLLACGWTFWGPWQYTAASVVDLGGYILIPSDIFAYSSLLEKLLQSVSVATIQAEDGGSMVAASPFALAGLLGLNLTAFSLFPGLHTDGSYVLRSLLRSKKLANEVISACTVMLTLSLCVQNPFLGLGWWAMSLMSEKDDFVKDDVSDPDLLTSLAGSVLVAGALACFIPFPQF